MSDPQYAKKACEEVIRLAEEKIGQMSEYMSKKNDEFTELLRTTEFAQKDVNRYFLNLAKQIEKVKMTFVHEIRETMQQSEVDHKVHQSQLQSIGKQLQELRDKTMRSIANGHPTGDTSVIFEVHNCIFSLEKAMEQFDEFAEICMPLKFVGKLDLESMPKQEIGSLERLLDLSAAEILPIKLPKIKLGQLFCLTFRLGSRYCPSAEKFLEYSVNKDAFSQSSHAPQEGNASCANPPSQLIKVESYLKDLKDGSYQLRFPITAIVPHSVHIRYLGHNIRNSPYTILFKVGNNNAAGGGTNHTMPVSSTTDMKPHLGHANV